MSLYPILIDSRPRYLGSGSRPRSLLLMPMGPGAVGGYIQSRLSEVTSNRLIVLPVFEPDDAYEAALREACPSAELLRDWAEFGARLGTYEPSDVLLVADPRCFPVEGFQPESLLRHSAADPRWVRHLVALDTTSLGTRECVEFGADGRVRRIQRYYESVTWPFTSGISCSMVPAACALRVEAESFASLSDLRRELSARGVPSRDLPMNGGSFDLTEEQGLLALSERFVFDLWSRSGNGGSPEPRRCVGLDCEIHPSARIAGPVILQDGAVVEEDATVLGPALVGAGAHIGRNAVVAQCVVASGVVVPENLVVYHRVLSQDVPAELPAVREPATPVYRGPASALGEALVDLEAERSGASIYPMFKFALERILAAAGLVLLSPLLLLIAALVKLESRGPALYGHKREGLLGRVFNCWKFRTMLEGAEAKERELYAQNQVDGPQFKLDHDPRITRVGRWLRPMSLDELPQLINVLTGEMSLVGPRPSPFRENQMCVPWREGRLSVRPGITGLWQVCRHNRKSGDFHQWIDYDLLYVRNMSLWLDTKILIATVLGLGGRRHVPLPWILSSRRLQQEQ